MVVTAMFVDGPRMGSSNSNRMVRSDAPRFSRSISTVEMPL